MPYVQSKERAEELRMGSPPETQGELTYVLSWHMSMYLERLLFKNEGLGYADLSSVRAACDDAQHEYCRRVLDPYEDAKRKTGADPYEGLFK